MASLSLVSSLRATTESASTSANTERDFIGIGGSLRNMVSHRFYCGLCRLARTAPLSRGCLPEPGGEEVSFDVTAGPDLHMAHPLASALQQTIRVREAGSTRVELK